MPSSEDFLEVLCPCCQTKLKIDLETHAVLSHKMPEKAPVIQDLAAEVARIKGEGSRLEQAFQKSFEAHKSQSTVLNKKFDELLKQAKESGDEAPPPRDFDL